MHCSDEELASELFPLLGHLHKDDIDYGDNKSERNRNRKEKDKEVAQDRQRPDKEISLQQGPMRP